MADNKVNAKAARNVQPGGEPQNGDAVSAVAVEEAAPPSEIDASDAAIPTTSRFRLPRFFSHAADQGNDAPDEMAIGELPDDPVKAPRPAAVPVTAIGKAIAAHTHRNGSAQHPAQAQGEPTGTPDQFSSGEENGESVVALSESDFSALVVQISDLTEQIRQVNERESVVEKVFNTLHSELADYKNDFLYEHLKPVVRPLLFLFDSIEQFDGEVAMAESSVEESATNAVWSPPVVRQNVSFFRDQLVEALRVCEVVLMDTPQGAFNVKYHKAVDVLPVAQEEDGQIMRVVRSGWFLNGQLLRPAEVVVGRFRPQP